VPELSSALSSEDRDTRGGRDVAVRILTLPTHGYVTEQDQIRIAEVVASVLNA
jgi:hypothetical protein